MIQPPFSFIRWVFLLLLFSLIVPPVSAQYPPGGIGNANGDEGQPLLKLWLPADSLSYSDGEDVTNWLDFSGNNNDFSADAGYSPIFRAGTLNGHDYLEFSKNANRIVRNPFNMPGEAVTVFMVMRPTNNDGEDALISYEGESDANNYLIYNPSSFYTRIQNNLYTTGITLTENNWQIVSHQWRSSDGRMLINVDGSELLNTSHQAGVQLAENLSLAIGGEQDGLDAGYNESQDYDGDIAELIMYGSSLQKAQQSVVENYLAQKYGLTITPDLYEPGDASYTVALTGMGKESDGTTQASCDGFVITQNGSFDNGEYLMTAHDGTENQVHNTPNVNDPEVEATWQRDWYVDTTGNMDVKLAFDFGEGINGDFPANIHNYRLMYKASLTDSYDTLDVAGKGVQNSDQLYFAVNNSTLAEGYYTLGTVDQANSPLAGVQGRTWYTLISGDWDNPDVWTLDPSGALPNNPNDYTPSTSPTSDADQVEILSGKTVTVSSNNKTNSRLTVEGRLDLQATSGHNFGVIRGGGKILLSGDHFPAGDPSHFVSEGQGEGTVEYYGGSYELDQPLEFYNLEINLNNASERLTLLDDYTINGRMNLKKGEFRINDNTTTTGLSMTVHEDLVVKSEGSVLTGEADARHQLNLYGDFINRGTVQLTNRTSPGYGSEATNGMVDANFLHDSRNQKVLCDGPTRFYRIEIDKGSDDTYILDLEATDPAHFELFGAANYHHGSTSQLSDNNNALGLIKGSVRIKNNVDIPVLSTATNYNISESARLWVDGGSVVKNQGNALVPYGKIRVSDGSLEAEISSGITTRGNGLIRVEGGTLSTNQIRTSVYGADNVGGYVQTGGTTHILGENTTNNYYCFNLTYPGNVFQMTGGTLHIHEAHQRGGIFIASEEANQKVTGGTVIMEIDDGEDFRITSRAPFWNVIVRNTHSGSGRHIVADGEDVGDGDLTTLPVQDLHVLNDLTIETGTTRTSGSDLYGSYLDLVPDNTESADLYVGGDLTIEDSGVLDVWKWDGSSNDGSARVIFNGSQSGTFHIGDITTYSNNLVQYRDPSQTGRDDSFDGQDETFSYWELPLYDVTIDKPNASLYLSSKSPVKGRRPSGTDASTFKASNGGKNVTQFGSLLLKVTGQFELLNGTLNQVDPNSQVTAVDADGDGNLNEGPEDETYGLIGDPVAYSMRLVGSDITNNDTCFVYEDGVTPKEGILVFRRDAGDFTLKTEEGAYFGNIRQNSGSDVVSLSSDVSIGRLEFLAGRMDIGTHHLKVDVFEFRTTPWVAENTIDQTDDGGVDNNQPVFSSDHYIRMAGNASDGGLSVKVPRLVSDPDDPNLLREFEDIEPHITQNEEYNNEELIWFPIGTDAGGSDKYTPAICRLLSNGNTDGDEYININIVDGELKTTDLSGGDILSYYWNVDFQGYSSGEEPTVSWLFQYDDSDVDGGNEGNYVPGKVMDSGDYNRSDEGGTNAVKEGGVGTFEGTILGDDPRNIIIYNGTGSSGSTVADDDIQSISNPVYIDQSVHSSWQNAWPNSGFTLEKANYTAGEASRFVGSPDIYYSRNAFFGGPGNCQNGCDIDQQDAIYAGCAGLLWDYMDDDWNGSYNGGNGGSGGANAYVAWSTTGHDGDPTNSLPGNGDIIQINECGKVVFYDEQVTFAKVINNGSMSFETNSNTNAFSSELGEVEGNGTIFFDYNNGGNSPSSLPNGDYGTLNDGFVSNDDSKFLFRIRDDANYEIPSGIKIYPNVDFYSSSSSTGYFHNPSSGDFGNLRKFTLPDEDMTINGNLMVQAGARVLLNTTSNGDITVKGDMTLGTSPNPDGRIGALYYQNNGTARTLSVEGDVLIRNGGHGDGDNDGNPDYSTIKVLDGGSAGLIHTLQVYGDIHLEDQGQLDLVGDDARAILDVVGKSDNEFSQDGTSAVPYLYRALMNKGTDSTYSFTFNDDFNLTGSTSGSGQEKALELQNGKLVLNDPGINIDLTTGDDDFYIPGSAALEVRQGQVNASGNSGILLDGALEVTGGTVDMSGGDNYIEYSASGNASIGVSAGQLTVGSQIRRGLTSTEGILDYDQSGGTVVVGQAAAPENNRGVMEVLNDGSHFSHTGGDLFIARAQDNPSTAALYLDPQTSSFGEGSFIHFGHSSTPTGETMGIYSTLALPNLVVNNSSGNDPTMELWTVPLAVTDSLEIHAGAAFDADGRDLTLRGDLVANGSFMAGGNTTLFSGSSEQEIFGSPAFWNLTKDQGNTLTLNASVTVSNELRLQAGTLDDGGNTLHAKGNVWMDAVHNHGGAGDGIALDGDEMQVLQADNGRADFGRLTINNPGGADSVAVTVPQGNDIHITHSLKMQQGIFHIGKNLLVLDQAAFIEEGNAFSTNNMIQTNISFTDIGIKKFFPDISSTTSFTYPIGSNGKYTPIVLEINDIKAGSSLRVKAADEIHPTITNDDEPCQDIIDTANVLRYHWLMDAENVSSFNGSIWMHYDEDDVQIDNTLSGTTYDIDDYITARLLLGSTQWNKYDPVSFEETNQRLAFSFTGADDESISGDYTAGIEDPAGNCEGAIPDKVPAYVTKQSGSWTNPDTWETYPDGTDDVPSTGPRGAIAIIEHEVTMPHNFILNYKTTIDSGDVVNGILKINDTYGHRLGIVDGVGTLQVERGDLPAGIYEEFFSADGGTLEYSGTADYDVLGGITQLNNLRFTGTGERRLANLNVGLYGNMDIAGSSDDLQVINEHNRRLEIQGNITFSEGSFDAGDGADALVRLDGSSKQRITGSFEDANAFNRLELNNSSGLEIVDSVEVDEVLDLSGGMVVIPDTGLVTLNSTAGDALSGASSSRFIQGPLRKMISGGEDYTFAVGDTSRYGEVSLMNNDASGPRYWQAQYFNNNPDHYGYDTSSTASTLKQVSGNEFWSIKGPGANADVRIRWDDESVLPAETDDRETNLHIAEYLSGQWESVGSGPGNVDDNGVNSGTVQTGSPVSLGDHVFTLASEETLPNATAAFVTQDTALCEGGEIRLVVELTGTSPWSLQLGLPNDPDSTIIDINTNRYTITIPNATAWNEGTYTLVSVSDVNGAGTTYGDPVDVAVDAQPDDYDLTADGTVATDYNLCDGSTVEIGLANSELDVVYELLRDGSVVQTVTGTGNPLTFGQYGTDGLYEVRAINGGCELWLSAQLTLNVRPVPDPRPYADPDTVCYAGGSQVTVLRANDITGSGTTFSWSPTDDLSDPNVENPGYEPSSNPDVTSIVKTYDVTVTSGYGCTGSGSLDVVLFRQPQTGTLYHIPNNFDQ